MPPPAPFAGNKLRGLPGNYASINNIVDATVDELKKFAQAQKTYERNEQRPPAEDLLDKLNAMPAHQIYSEQVFAILLRKIVSLRDANQIATANAMCKGLALFSGEKNRINVLKYDEVKETVEVNGKQVEKDFSMSNDPHLNRGRLRPGLFVEVYAQESLKEDGVFTDETFIPTSCNPAIAKPYIGMVDDVFPDGGGYTVKPKQTLKGKGPDGAPKALRKMCVPVYNEGSDVPQRKGEDAPYFTRGLRHDKGAFLNTAHVIRCTFRDYVRILPGAELTPESLVRYHNKMLRNELAVEKAAQAKDRLGVTPDMEVALEDLGAPSKGQHYILDSGSVTVRNTWMKSEISTPEQDQVTDSGSATDVPEAHVVEKPDEDVTDDDAAKAQPMERRNTIHDPRNRAANPAPVTPGPQALHTRRNSHGAASTNGALDGLTREGNRQNLNPRVADRAWAIGGAEDNRQAAAGTMPRQYREVGPHYGTATSRQSDGELTKRGLEGEDDRRDERSKRRRQNGGRPSYDGHSERDEYLQ